MPRRRTEAEYQQLKKFLGLFTARYRFVAGLPPELHPVARLEALEKISASKARDGLRQAINDIVEMSFRFDLAEVRALDTELRALGIVTLSEVRRQSGRHFAKIIKRGKIKTETEYYLVCNMLDDRAENSPEERELLAKMISEYEEA